MIASSQRLIPKSMVMKKESIKKIRFQDLRYAHATLCLLSVENPKKVQERLGDASVRITLVTYSHELPNMQKNTAENFSRTLMEILIYLYYPLYIYNGS